MPMITNKMIFAGLSQNVAASQARLQSAQMHAATGRRVVEAADDPVAAARGTVVGIGIQQLEGMHGAAASARQGLSTADQSMRQATTFLARAKELAIAGANGGLSAENRQALGAEAAELHAAVLQIANAQIDGKYIFAGLAQSTAPFAADGTYAGDAGANQLEVAPGLEITANIPGSQTFNVAGGVNVLGMLQTLQSGLMNDNVADIRTAIDGADDATAQIGQAQGEVGAQLGQLNAGETARETALQTLETALEDNLQVDMAQSFSDMLQAQAAYQAAVAEATRILTGLGNGLNS